MIETFAVVAMTIVALATIIFYTMLFLWFFSFPCKFIRRKKLTHLEQWIIKKLRGK